MFPCLVPVCELHPLLEGVRDCVRSDRDRLIPLNLLHKRTPMRPHTTWRFKGIHWMCDMGHAVIQPIPRYPIISVLQECQAQQKSLSGFWLEISHKGLYRWCGCDAGGYPDTIISHILRECGGQAVGGNARVLENTSKTYSAGEAQHGDCESPPKVYLSLHYQKISPLSSASVSQLHLTCISSNVLLRLGKPAQETSLMEAGSMDQAGTEDLVGSCVLGQADHSLTQHKASAHQPH